MDFCGAEVTLALGPDKQWGDILVKDEEGECVFPGFVLSTALVASK